MISVIIPLYNQEKNIKNCLDSLLSQTIKDWEVIIVNDGSTDNGFLEAKKFIPKFEELNVHYKILEQPNGGAPSARNYGWRESQGEYLFFCDADTVLEKDCLEKMLEALMKNPASSYAYSSFYFGKKIFKAPIFSPEKLRQMPYICTMSLIRRENFPKNGWDESIKKFQDWDLWLTILENGYSGISLKEPLYGIKTGGTMSDWLPAIAYKLLPFLPTVKKYKKAREIIKAKHQL